MKKLAFLLLLSSLAFGQKFSLENKGSPQPSGQAGDIPYAVNTTTIGWIPHATGLQCLTQNGTATPVWAACNTGAVTGSGALNQVAIWSSASALTGFATLTYSASNLYAETSVTVADTAKTASTTFRYDNALFGVDSPELEVANNNPLSSGFKWNVMALRALANDQYSAQTFRSPDGREHGAVGFGNSSTDAPYVGTTYFESSFFPFSGVTVPPNLLFVQAGFMGGSNGSRRRLEFQGADGIVHFYKTDGTTKMLSLDTVNSYFALNTAGSFTSTATGLNFGIVGATTLGIANTAGDAAIRLDAGGVGQVPAVDYYFGHVKKANVAWQNTAPARLVINDQAQNTTIGENGGNLSIATTATTYKNTNAGADVTARIMARATTGQGALAVDFDESGATVTGTAVDWNAVNTSSNQIRHTALFGTMVVRTAGAETGRLEVYSKPAAAGVTAISRWDGTTLHQEFTGTAPALSTCGGSPSIVGNDHIGKVTIGSGPGATCTVTFSKVWTNAPACFATNETTANLVRGTTTASVLTLRGTLTAGDVISYGCMGRY